MVLAGGLVWANTKQHISLLSGYLILMEEYGWPFRCVGWALPYRDYANWYWEQVGYNLLIAVSILGASVFICELIARRPWRYRLRLHLSTCIVLLFVVGFLMWGNFVPRRSHDMILVHEPFIIRRDYAFYGWPWMAFQKITKEESKLDSVNLSDSGWSEEGLRDLVYDLEPLDQFSYSAVVMNSAVGFCVLLMVAIFSEYLIRRRARLRSSSVQLHK